MTARVRLAIKRLEEDLHGMSGTMSSQFVLFLEDLNVLINYAKRTKEKCDEKIKTPKGR